MHHFLAQTCIAQSQLPADHCTVWSGKEVLTNSAPEIVVADLHSTFISVVTINKPHISFSAVSYGNAVHQDNLYMHALYTCRYVSAIASSPMQAAQPF